MKPLKCTKFLMCASAAALIVLGFNDQASAQEGSIMAVVHASDPGSQKAAAYAKYYVRNYFAADSRYDTVDIDKLSDADAIQAGAREIQAASVMVQKGREAYDSLELDDAIEFLKNAIKKYETYISFLESPRQLSEAYIALGAAYILRGEEREGKKNLIRAIQVDPAHTPDSRIFNPTMMEIFTDARDEANSSGRGAIQVISNPGYSEVHLDGKFIGVTPLSKGEIPSGHHYIQVRQDGYRTTGRVIDLAPHNEESLSLNMEATKEASRFRDMYSRAIQQLSKDGLPDSIRELADYFKVTNMFLAEVKVEGEMLVMTGAQYNITTGQKVKMAKTTLLFDNDQFEYAVQKYMNDNFSADNLFKEPVESNPNGCNSGVCADGRFCTADADCQAVATAHTRKPSNPMSSTKKLVSFSLLGGGGGMMIIGAGLWGGAWYKASFYKAEKNRNSISQTAVQSYAKSGKALAATGDTLFIIGTAAALAGGSLLAFWHPEGKKKSAAKESDNGSFKLSGSFAPVDGGAYASLYGTF